MTYEITTAVPADVDAVQNLVHSTIKSVYTGCYSPEVVKFFLDYNTKEIIAADIALGVVHVMWENGVPVATVTIKDNVIRRMFVADTLLGKGIGGKLMDFAEAFIAKNYSFARLDASLPGYSFYFRRGFRTEECGYREVEGGKRLFYQVMRKSFNV